MSPRLKTALALAIYPTFAWAIVIFFVAFVFGFFEGGDHESLRLVATGISYPVVLTNVIAAIYALIWSVRNLRGNQRVGWIVGLLIGGSIALLVWWWVVIRPLPESPSTAVPAPS